MRRTRNRASLAVLAIAVVASCGLDPSLSRSPQLPKQESPEPVPPRVIPPEESFASLFNDGYEMAVEHSSAGPETEMRTAGLESFSSYRFRRKTPLPGSTAAVHPRFRLRVFRYVDAENAALAAARFRALVEESHFYKSPLLLFRDASVLYLLEGECTFSEENWLEIDQQLVRSIVPWAQPPPAGAFRVACGGAILDDPRADSGR